MMKAGKDTSTRMNKGLSDRELIAKYESGKISVKSVVARMLKTKSSTAVKNSKKK